MSIVRQLVDTNIDLENEEVELLDDDRLNALIHRKLEKAQISLYGGGREYSEEEVDEVLEKILLKAEQNVHS